MGDTVLKFKNLESQKPSNKEPLHLVEEGDTEKGGRFLRVTLTVVSLLFLLILFLSLSIFGNNQYYTIRKGESAHIVASKFNVPLSILMTLNDMTHPGGLQEGMRVKIPTIHDVHIIREGDTLYSIADQYGIKRYELVRYNRNNDVNRMRTGERVFIPRTLTNIHVSVDVRTGLVPFTVRFNIDTNTRDRIRSYRWIMGSETLSRQRNPSFTYKKKGTYYVSLAVVDENGNEVKSNTIPVVARSLAHIGFNARKYVTLNRDDEFSLETDVIDNLKNSIEFNYETEIIQEPKLLRQIGKSDRFEIINTGYSKIKFRVKGYEHIGYFFISPVESRHVPGPDVEWYKTQYGTGINGNCGPASVAMGIHWATSTNLAVQDIRSQIGMPHKDGGIGFSHMTSMFQKYKTRVRALTINSIGGIINRLDRGEIAIVLIHSGGIKQTKQKIDNTIFDRYYSDSVGHYVILKGYTLDRQHFIVYDPIPGDWIMNRIRYSDGVSMIGKNRYYSTENVFNSLKTPTILVISQSKK